MDLAGYSSTIIDTINTRSGSPIATDDPRNLRLPGVLVALKEIRPATLDGPAEVDWDVVAIVPASAQPLALASLGDLATLLAPLALTWQSTNYLDPNLSSDPLPALVGTLTLDCED